MTKVPHLVLFQFQSDPLRTIGNHWESSATNGQHVVGVDDTQYPVAR